jgi:hypothetical protein
VLLARGRELTGGGVRNLQHEELGRLAALAMMSRSKFVALLREWPQNSRQ